MRAVELVLQPDQYFSHVTAALLWGCLLPFRVDAARTLHVTTIGDGPIVRRSGIVGHRIAASRAEVSPLMDPRASSPEAAWYECRSMLSLRELVVLGDHLVGRSGLADRDDLAGRIMSGDRWVRRARAALDLIRVGAESAMESTMRLVVGDAGFPEPELNVDIHDSTGRFIGRVDMAWPELRIIVEYDGDHHRDRSTFQDDARRRNAFLVEGWAALHVTALDAREPDAFLVRLAELFHARRAA